MSTGNVKVSFDGSKEEFREVAEWLRDNLPKLAIRQLGIRVDLRFVFGGTSYDVVNTRVQVVFNLPGHEKYDWHAIMRAIVEKFPELNTEEGLNGWIEPFGSYGQTPILPLMPPESWQKMSTRS